MQHRNNPWFLKTAFCLCLSLVVFVAFQVQAAEWFEFYKDAQKNLQQKEWDQAIQLLKQAIEKDPQPGKRKEVPGKRPIRYFPYLELGKAYYEIGDYEEAFRSCEESRKKGAAPKALVVLCLKKLRSSRDLSEPTAQRAERQRAPEPKSLTAKPERPGLPAQEKRPPVKNEQNQPLQPDDTAHQTIQPGAKIAVLNFQGLLVDDDLGVAVAEIIRTEVVGLGDYTVIERGMVEQVLKEQELQLTGTVDPETAVEIGKLIGAEFVIIGSIVKTGTVYTINARLIDVETGVVKVGQNIQGQGEETIPDMVKELTRQMIYQPPT